MKSVALYRWYLPNPNPRGKPYLSRFHMTDDEAKQRRAIRPEPTSRMDVPQAETEDEQRELLQRSDTAIHWNPPES